ncbi:MAG: hypothetical protein IT210_04310 [Armatimonadetes bacterium]|nr:hypothetical protein [Armatimonadota bacterium]
MKLKLAFGLLAAAVGAWEASHYGPGRQLAVLEDPAIAESSGLAASRLYPGIYWTHNDSGDGPYLYAFDRQGKTVGRHTVEGATARDWEDMAAGPGKDGKPALYIGDIGDNGRRRKDTCVYRIPEPVLDVSRRRQQGVTAKAEIFPFRYPDGCHNAETLMVHPKTGVIYIVTKEITGIAGVYRFPSPLEAGRQVTLQKVGSLSFEDAPAFVGMIPAGDIAPDGRRFVVRTYQSAYEYRLPAGKLFEAIFKVKPLKVALPAAQQGEAIAYRADGKSLLATSEKLPTPLHEVEWIP